MPVVKNLLLLTPMFKGKIEDEKKLMRTFNNWRNANLSEFARRDVNPDWIAVLRGKPIINQETGIEDLYFGLVSKGKIARDYLKTMHKIANGENEKVYDYVICIDGDGDIPFNNIFRFLDALLAGEVACLSCREGKFGLGEERNNIERSELNVLEAIFDCSLPDGQCGCWALHHSIVDKLGLTAVGFEIELDILIGLMDNGIQPLFIPLQVHQEVPSTFEVSKAHSEKMAFLSRRLKLGKDDFIEIHKNFMIEHSKALPKTYTELFSGIGGQGSGLRSNARRTVCGCEKTFNKVCNRCDRAHAVV